MALGSTGLRSAITRGLSLPRPPCVPSVRSLIVWTSVGERRRTRRGWPGVWGVRTSRPGARTSRAGAMPGKIGNMQPTQAGTQPPSSPTWLTMWKDSSAATASTLTALSLVAAAIGSYILFIRDRQRFPRAKVTHRLYDWPAEHVRMVRGVIRVENVGNVVIELRLIRGVLTQILPLPSDVMLALARGGDPVDKDSTEVVWDTLRDRLKDFSKESCEVEPGEVDEFFFDFVIPSNVTKVQFYSHVENVKKWKRNVGWNTTIIYDVGDGKNPSTSFRTGQGHAKPVKAPPPPKKA